MHLHNQIEATKENFLDLVSNYPKGEPVVMINILKFKDKVEGGAESGKAAYVRYSKNVFPLLQKAGAKVIWSGKVKRTIIGDQDDQPDTVLLVEYPAIENFIAMCTSKEYYAIAHDRVMSLEYGGLMASTTI